MKWLLDTNVISETIRPRPDRRVIAWIDSQPDHAIAISVITLAELREGIESDQDQLRRRRLANWLETTVTTLLSQRIVSLDGEILIDWLRLSRQLARKRITRQAPDLLLASTARSRDLTIVTRNTRDFANTGITVYNPWTDETQKMEAP